MLTLQDYEDEARKQLAPEIFDFFAGGSGDEGTLQRNRAIFQEVLLQPRVLTGRCSVATQTTLLGRPVSLPIAIAPTAYLSLAHEAGELAVVSINASHTLEAIRDAAPGLLWQQLYLYPDRAVIQALLARAASYSALVLTVGRPLLGKCERDLRNAFPLRAAQAANFAATTITPRQDACPATWEDVEWLRSVTSLPIVLKGILRADDARLAVEHGASAIIVSNHGGRQLDGALTGLEALPAIVEAVAGRCEIYLDGGIRRGTDVLKALALGARAVLIGRPVVWGLAVDGTQGVQRVLEILRDELELAMALTGCANLESITADLLFV